MRSIIIASIATLDMTVSIGGMAQAAAVTVQLGNEHYQPPVVLEQ